MYKVLIDTLNHNGRLRIPGELIAMDDVDAAPLIKIGAIETAATVADKQSQGSNDPGNTDPKTGSDDDADPEQPQATAAQSGGADDAQEQPVASASAPASAGSDAPKSGRRDSKPKAK